MRAPEQQHAEMYEFLMKTEGWSLMAEWLQASAQESLEAAIKSGDPYQTARALGAVAAFRQVLQRPGMLVAGLKALQEP